MRRVLASFVAGLGGLLLVGVLTVGLWWSVLAWLGVGLVVGSIAGRARWVWIAWVSEAAFYPLSIWLGVTSSLGPFWLLGALLGAALLTVGFTLGTTVGWARDPRTTASGAWRAMGRRWRLISVGGLVIALLGLAGYLGYVGATGSELFIHAPHSADCATPGTTFGWAFEAINYDSADDQALAAANPDMSHCRSQGEPAGDTVVTSDGIHIDGWYIPAADGSGPTGPTVLLVPGWQSNKSGMLKYAPPFHDAFNVVLIDLRNSGRSSPTETTMGVREKLDVEAMVDWLERTKHPGWIAAMGNSMGGATVLAAAAGDQRIRAVILDSVHAHFVVTAGDIAEDEYGQPSVSTGWVIAAFASWRIGADVTSVDPARTITQLGDRPVLLLHGLADVVDRPAESAEVNFQAALAAGVPVELHYCAGAGHAMVIDRCPLAWAQWATSFLDAAMRPAP